MENSIEKNDYLIQIRDKLRKDGITLWQMPYHSESAGIVHGELETLSQQFSEVLKIPLEICTQILIELLQASLENKKNQTRFQDCGLATLKLKIVAQGKPPKMLTKELVLTSRGIDLKEIVSQEVSLSTDRIKLISAGRVLNNNDSLKQQGVKNGQQVLVIILSESQGEAESSEANVKELESVKTDSKLLALDDDYMRLEDQFGNQINIPKHEKKALIIAMTLHEKGKASLKREDYSRALIFFLEADREFSNCSSTILNSVDNYALLELDIAWCYLCLQSFTHLPTAQTRLERCEEKFTLTYGKDLERVMALKGSSGNEACLLMRLHLLQAIVLYHENKRPESWQLFKKVENELSLLKVDESSVMSLIELGFSIAEARIGLRASGGDVNQAANYINEQREKRHESRKKAKAEKILQKERKKLGKCKDGVQYVDPNFLKMLVSMGYNKEVARQALKECNNIISDSIQYIQENPLPGPSQSKSMELMTLIEDLVPQLVEAGFDPRMAKLALQKHNADIMKSAEELLANSGIVLGDLSQFNIHSESIEAIKKQKEKEEKKNEALNRLKEDISIADDDHLDFNLVQEEMYLKQYLSLLEK